MTSSIEILGVYNVEAEEPVCLIEMLVRNSEGPLDVGQITQPWPGKDRSSWQIAYDERVLNRDGTAVLFDPWLAKGDVSAHWLGDVRLAFFFHYLDFDRKLQTPLGDVAVPDAKVLPKRLGFMSYSPP